MKGISKWGPWSLFSGAMAFIMAGCSNAPLKPAATPYVYDTTLTVATPPVTNIDPLAGTTAGDQLFDQMVYQTLTTLSPNGRAEPGLASSWHVNRTGTVWTIQLNPFAKWWTGRPVTARDVAWTLELYQNPKTGFVDRAELQNVAKVAVQSPTVFTIRLKTPDPDFAANVLSPTGHLYILPRFLLARVPPASIKRAVALTQLKDVVGSGPYRPIDWTSHNLVWLAYPHYLYGPPHVKYLAWWWTPLPTGAPEMRWTWQRVWPVTSHDRVILDTSTTAWVLVVHAGTGQLSASRLATVLSLATNRRLLPGIPAPSTRWPGGRAANWSRSEDAFRRQLHAAGYRRTPAGWVSGTGTPLSLTLEIPEDSYGQRLANSLMEQWRRRGLVIIPIPASLASAVNVTLAPMVATPVPEPLPADQVTLAWEPQNWIVTRRLEDWTANPWQPFGQVQTWRLKPSRRSHH